MTMPVINRTLRTVGDLVEAGLVLPEQAHDLDDVAARYAIAIPPALAALIDPDDPDDPIALQFVPQAAELVRLPQERDDPIGDEAHSPVEGIVHRYPDRVLLKLLHVCPVYCRFCFRRESVGPHGAATVSEAEMELALDYIAGHREIWEVILTGGDPLILSQKTLAKVVQRLAAIPHVKILRLHTRVPVADPARVSAELARTLRAEGLTTYLALHANHPREMTPAARLACARLADTGVVLLGQSVLLRGVNDNAETLAALMRAFVEARVKPYYLHHPDLAPGTAHFRLTIAEGQKLVRTLRGQLSGLCQPTYMLDIPGGHGKVPLGPVDVSVTQDGAEVVDFRGVRHGV